MFRIDIYDMTFDLIMLLRQDDNHTPTSFLFFLRLSSIPSIIPNIIQGSNLSVIK
jgi:hypothetical protein